MNFFPFFLSTVLASGLVGSLPTLEILQYVTVTPSCPEAVFTVKRCPKKIWKPIRLETDLFTLGSDAPAVKVWFLGAQKPDIYRCIRFNHDRLGYNAKIQVCFASFKRVAVFLRVSLIVYTYEINSMLKNSLCTLRIFPFYRTVVSGENLLFAI